MVLRACDSRKFAGGMRGLTRPERCIFATKAAKCDRIAGKSAALEPDVIQPSLGKSRAGTSVDH
jgi:hypothetical protein